MRIDDLINDLLAEQPHLTSELQMQVFLNRYPVSDQLALISAYCIGIKHSERNSLLPDCGPFHRTLHELIGEPSQYAEILFKKRLQFSHAMASFINCSTQELRDKF